MTNIIQELQARSLYHSCTRPDIADGRQLTVYAGFDATASSLHVGNLTTLMMLRLFKKYGHNIIVLLGGATTKIGDPSGKDAMRKMLDHSAISANKKNIEKAILSIVPNAQIVDNEDWFGNMGYIDLLRDVGGLFSINRMLTMESVKSRIERQQNLSFLEFNYMVLQSYDFWHLYKKYGCNVQIGGSDQWGNIVCGIDLIHKKEHKAEVFGVTAPLITRSDGKKMGKSEDGAIWLDPAMLGDFEYFQYFRNTIDEDVVKMLLIFTDLEVAAIEHMSAHMDINGLKALLAFEATKICRGSDAAEGAKKRSEILFTQRACDAESAIMIDVKAISLLELLKKLGAISSSSEGKKLIAGGGVKIDKVVIVDHSFVVEKEGCFMVSVGKKRHFTVKLLA